MIASDRKGRSGYSLIEMVFVIGGVSLILTMCGTLMHGMLRLDRAGKRAIVESTTLARLARQFREDVRASEKAEIREIDSKAGAIQLTMPDKRKVEYQTRREFLWRVEEVEGKAKSQEAYGTERLGPYSFFKDGERVRLMMGRRQEGVVTPAIDRLALSVEARVGKDRAGRKPRGVQP